VRLDEITGTLNKDDFSTYSAAVDYARLQASKRGYTVSDDVWHNEITVGSGAPAEGETVRHNLELMYDDQAVEKHLAIQVYNRGTDTGTYELNYYIT
tara:strand:+ start:4376 stop:4666 length:291 start_codon:yes stop_codon:yes gene_type:complete